MAQIVLEQVQKGVTMGVIYQRPGRPVWVGIRPGLRDLQGAIPRFWCANCGTEVFWPGRELCRGCEKEEIDNDKQAKPL